MADLYSPTDQEVIVLKSIWDSIDEMVNYALFMKFARTEDTELRFQSSIHQRFFNVLLADFLTAPSPWPFGLKQPAQDAPKSMQNILFHLQQVGENPILNPTGGKALLTPLRAFHDWLETECFVEDVWLPSIELKTNILVKRFAFIKICGNIGKHNFARLSRVVNDICGILEANGAKVDLDQGYLVIDEFYEWFHDNVFAYHSSAIAEFLNNIRWGMYDYLRPEFQRSFTRDSGDTTAYRFIYPTGSKHPTGKTMYWNLMNDVRGPPYMPRFEVTKFLKMHY